ncbi:MAG: hypothetical protein ACWGMT_01325 [Burkholderiales bacterium]
MSLVPQAASSRLDAATDTKTSRLSVRKRRHHGARADAISLSHSNLMKAKRLLHHRQDSAVLAKGRDHVHDEEIAPTPGFFPTHARIFVGQ